MFSIGYVSAGTIDSLNCRRKSIVSGENDCYEWSIIMNKQQKQEMGQGLVDFMLDDLSLDEIAETFEMKVDTKFYSYEEDKENLVKDWKIKFPKWDIWIRRAYKEIWSGDINYEEIRFSGDGEDFNEWLKIKWYEAYRDIDWDE